MRATRIRKSIRAFSVIELIIVIALIDILVAIAIPNVLRYQAHAQQAEARSNLKAVWIAEKAYYQTNESFTPYVAAIGFNPERGNRYTYALGNGVRQDRRTSAASASPTEEGIEADIFWWGMADGIAPVMPAAITAVVRTGKGGYFSASAAGNIDSDATLDQWSVSSLDRIAAKSSDALIGCAAGDDPAGEPCVDQDDVAL